MKSSSILASAALLAALVVAAPASAQVSAVFTMADAVITQTVKVPGCASLTTGTSGLATATFFSDYTYSIDRVDSVLPTQTGNYAVTSTPSAVTLWMAPDQTSLNAWFGTDNGVVVPPTVIGAMNINILANCQLKYPSATVSILAPTVVASKNSMVMKTKDNSGTLTYAVKGLQTNTFKGTPKVGKFSATITLKGNVVEAPSFTM